MKLRVLTSVAVAVTLAAGLSACQKKATEANTAAPEAAATDTGNAMATTETGNAMAGNEMAGNAMAGNEMAGNAMAGNAQ